MKNFITIGDVTNDAFIKLKECKVECEQDKCTLCMDWGSKIPYEKVDVIKGVGNSANASVSMTRLGAQITFVSFVGDDEHGRECIKYLTDQGVNTEFIKTEIGKNTNYHYVLSYNAERTILVKHEDFTYSLPNIPKDTEWIYLSSLGENSLDFHKEIENYIKQNKNIKLVFQPGTFQMKLGYEKLKTIYENTHVFVCNKQEAQSILKTYEDDIKILMEMIYKKGPKIVSITDGQNGAYAYDGYKALYIPQYPDIDTPKERTGAGDAYTSTLAYFLSEEMELKDALLRAPINSMSVVQEIGAQKGLLLKNEIENYLKKAKENYKVCVI